MSANKEVTRGNKFAALQQAALKNALAGAGVKKAVNPNSKVTNADVKAMLNNTMNGLFDPLAENGHSAHDFPSAKIPTIVMPVEAKVWLMYGDQRMDKYVAVAGSFYKLDCSNGFIVTIDGVDHKLPTRVGDKYLHLAVSTKDRVDLDVSHLLHVATELSRNITTMSRNGIAAPTIAKRIVVLRHVKNDTGLIQKIGLNANFNFAGSVADKLALLDIIKGINSVNTEDYNIFDLGLMSEYISFFSSSPDLAGSVVRVNTLDRVGVQYYTTELKIVKLKVQFRNKLISDSRYHSELATLQNELNAINYVPMVEETVLSEIHSIDEELAALSRKFDNGDIDASEYEIAIAQLAAKDDTEVDNGGEVETDNKSQ